MNAVEFGKDITGEENLFNDEYYRSKEDNIIIGQKPEDFEILKFLGKGGFGKVYKVKYKLNNQIYAMKIFDKNIDKIKSNLSIKFNHPRRPHQAVCRQPARRHRLYGRLSRKRQMALASGAAPESGRRPVRPGHPTPQRLGRRSASPPLRGQIQDAGLQLSQGFRTQQQPLRRLFRQQRGCAMHGDSAGKADWQVVD